MIRTHRFQNQLPLVSRDTNRNKLVTTTQTALSSSLPHFLTFIRNHTPTKRQSVLVHIHVTYPKGYNLSFD